MDSTGTQNSPVWGMRPVQFAWLGVALVTLFRFWYMCRYDLVPDEAYFWVWSKHFALATGQRPLVAWTIALGTRLFGDTVLGVRFFAVLLSAATAFQLFQLARRCTMTAPRSGALLWQRLSRCSPSAPF